MKEVFRIIGSEKDLADLNTGEENVHFCFRPSEKNILELVKRCPKLKRIQLPSSYHKTISNTTKMFLNLSNVKLIMGDIWGHRTDIDRFAEIEV
ncbi:Protein of unknown function (DUF1699) [Candidatus Methanoperedens nitroreducens]|uniref:DUF1699 family protein n=1 Tax=Candidatus Methanoperedens nitratireducens TaxID=1392998 RepID=A0A062V7F0_9EURY|nr:DUF1699 family protein [Candidatus Methanoperedens nitroreducens]KCZ72453.1 Protein of unknown function (DUF1699) [Candidatus Methanoperedens nitroreducens]MDJ1423613.1 DUF1699 family protein [Candidatus Methanoperedens sp.]